MEVVPVFSFVVGMMIGSFLNVCVYRIPREGLSVCFPRKSICPGCQSSIRFVDNIPVLSFMLLRGRCRNCKSKISVLYPVVELMTAGLFLMMFYRFGWTLNLALGCLFVTLLVPISCIDAQWYIIPNVIIAVGLALGLGLVAGIALSKGDWYYLLERLIGAVIGGGVILAISVLGSAILRSEAMGGGDIKLMVLIGLFLGVWPNLLIVIVLSAFIGSVVGGFLVVLRRREAGHPIPYGPFLALAALLDFVWGEAIWDAYLKLIGWT